MAGGVFLGGGPGAALRGGGSGGGILSLQERVAQSFYGEINLGCARENHVQNLYKVCSRREMHKPLDLHGYVRGNVW